MFDNIEIARPKPSLPGALAAPASLPSLSAPAAGDMADLLVAYLEQIGTDYVFAVPGGAIEPLYDAISRNLRKGGTLRHIVARHEAGAAFMADGYARETGRIGVCAATSGPGATNMLTAVATAYGNGVAMLVITGQPALPSFGRHGLQESACTGIDVLAMFRHCTRYNSLVSHAQQLEWKLTTALQHAIRTPAGPVHLSVPVDVFRAPSSARAPGYNLDSLLLPAALLDESGVQRLLAMLSLARNVVLMVGADCGSAIDSLLRFAALRGAAFVTAPDAKGLVSPQHPLYRGVFGFGGHASAEAALRDPSVDLIIAAGGSMGEWNTGGWSDALLNSHLVHIDQSEEHLARTPMARLHVRGSVGLAFDRLSAAMQREPSQHSRSTAGHPAQPEPGLRSSRSLDMLAAPQSYFSDAAPLKPQRLMKELGELFPHNTRFLADAGNSVAWAAHYLQPQDRRMGERRSAGGDRPCGPGRRRSSAGWLRLTCHFAPMGWAIGAAIGTAAGNPSAPVMHTTGDGSMLMSGQELSVAVAEQQCVIFVILNDGALGMVKHGQRLARAEQIGYALPPTDFAALSRALGGRGHTIRTVQQLQALDIGAICKYPGPTLLDVHIDPEEVPPIGSRLRVLQDHGQ